MEKLVYTIEAGENAQLNDSYENNDYNAIVVVATPDDVDTVYEALACGLVIGEGDVEEFENVADDNVETLLQSMKKAGFVSDWTIEG